MIDLRVDINHANIIVWNSSSSLLPMVHSVCGILALVDLGKAQATSMMDQVAVKTQTVGMTWLKMARF